ncbi:Response regulator receiver domain protein [Hoeflea sp. IMCC20628]|uniref:response regulator n=1 Tax=Hoeflea sp. IMCC20628 TaxID=1620421 RepID=UPI00063BF678|nr:response regulator [Hoeflea sp. IMCC20628]AKI01739.1 Response regulator receiver domain protein [Hoeflea sp. IMCC20628]
MENGEAFIEEKEFSAAIGSSRRVLWVDDFPINNAHLIESFKEKGVDIDLSISTEDALSKISSLDYSAVISDLGRMENGFDNKFAGLELLKLIRKIDEKMPVLIFAGARGLGSRAKLMEAGAEDVVSSSVSVVKFVEKYAGKS